MFTKHMMDTQLPAFDVGQENVFSNTTRVINSTGTLLNGSSDGSKMAVTPDFPKSFLIICTLLFILIFLMGILGNVLVMSVVCFNRNMKTAVNLYLFNLCVADILVLTICMPTALAEIYTKDAWYFGEAMCKIVPFLENTVANGSVLTILAISFERYRVVCKPLKGIKENTRKIVKIVIIIWIISAVASMPSLSMATFRDSRHLDGTPIKVCRNSVRQSWHKMYVVSLALFFFGLPCSLLFCLYLKICCVLKAAHKENINMDDAHKYRDRKVLQFQVMNIITSIVFLFFICHLPFRVIGLWLTFENMYKIASLGFVTYYNILYFGRLMFYLNHAANPIIYNFVSTKFRHALRYMLTGKTHMGSFISSQRRQKKENCKLIRHRQSRVLLVDHEPETRNKESDCEPSSSFSSDVRKNRNQFFPMYAHILQGSEENSDSSGPKCELNIQLVDKQLALNINYSKKSKFNNNYHNGNASRK